jgi:hypothetical protein
VTAQIVWSTFHCTIPLPVACFLINMYHMCVTIHTKYIPAGCASHYYSLKQPSF